MICCESLIIMISNNQDIYNKVILVFDICSSSNIIENLTLTDNVAKLKQFFSKLKT